MKKIHKWARAALEKSEGVKGRLVEFEDGPCGFYVTMFKSGRRERPLIFRVHPHRQYMDRFHWWFVQERVHVDFPESYRVVDVRPAEDKHIQRWLDTHHWTCVQKGFPVAKKWRRRLSEALFWEQIMLAEPKKWLMDFATLEVVRYTEARLKRIAREAYYERGYAPPVSF